MPALNFHLFFLITEKQYSSSSVAEDLDTTAGNNGFNTPHSYLGSLGLSCDSCTLTLFALSLKGSQDTSGYSSSLVENPWWRGLEGRGSPLSLLSSKAALPFFSFANPISLHPGIVLPMLLSALPLQRCLFHPRRKGIAS